MARLILESGGERRELKVTGPITIGRSPEATVHVDDKTLSREHTRIYLDHGRVFVKDLGSKNGTFLNGALIRQAEPLKHGDRIKVGPAQLTVVLEAGDALPSVRAPLAPPPPPPPPASPPASRAPRHVEAPVVSGPSGAEVLFYRAILLGVVGAGAWLSKPLFVMLLNSIKS